jgi:sec-independent protein translocase protein TatB
VFEFSWLHMLILLVAALFILGPERLPEAAAWLGRTVRQIREFASGAQRQLREEMGPEFDEFRKPLEDLRQLRTFDPKRAITQQLFDGDPDPLGLTGTSGGSTKLTGTRASGASQATTPPDVPAPRQKPPIDPDAT